MIEAYLALKLLIDQKLNEAHVSLKRVNTEMLKIVKSEEHPLMEIVNVCLIQFYHVTGNVN